MTLTPMATAPAASGPAQTMRPGGQRLTMRERREALARHRQQMIRLVTGKTDWIPVIVLASILMSPEARIDIGGWALYPYRVMLFASLPFMLLRVAREPIRMHLGDVFVLCAGVTMFLATIAHYSIDVAIKTGGASTFDLLGAYAVGRVFFRNSLDLRQFLYRIGPLVFAVAAVMFLESISHRYIFRPFVGALSGHSPAAALNRMYEIRNGFLRATGPFLHPIAAGLFFGSLVPLFVAADLPKRRWIGLLACTGGIFGWSSAAAATIAAGFSLGFYDAFQRRYRIGWLPVIVGLLSIAVLLQVLSDQGLIKILIRYASFNPQTGYYRLAIWDYGSANVAKSPWIGIGYFESYTRPKWMHSDSVDNYWLLLALRYGVPCSIFLLLAVLSNATLVALVKQGQEKGALYGRRMATGVVISIVVLFAVLLTVAPWGADISWMIMLLGIAGGLANRHDPVERPALPSLRSYA